MQQRIGQLKRRSGKYDVFKDEMSSCTGCTEVEALRQTINSDQVLRISIIAHSMGGLIADDLIDENTDLFFQDVVYMAAANKIRTFSSTALEYMRQNPATQLHSLSLHPFREDAESHFWNLVPEGSLLTWIDRFLSNPITEEDKTLGTWTNLADTLTVSRYLSGDERARLFVRVYGIDGEGPQMHGQFNDPPQTKPQDHGYKGSEFWKIVE